MKKIAAFILVSTLALSLAACSEKNSSLPEGGKSPGFSANIGDTVRIGGYNWRILDLQDGKALILSDKILTGGTYGRGSTTWEESDLRQYLNGSFFEDTFTSDEKDLIAESRIVNESNQWYGTTGGNATTDKVFLLSIDEAVKYFGDSGQLANRSDGGYSSEDNYDSARIAENKDTGTASWWWLRSPGHYGDLATYVDIDGGVNLYGNYVGIIGGIRPALWLNL